MAPAKQNEVDEGLALAVFIKLLRATEAVSAAVHCRLSEAHLSVSQFGVLEALYHCGPMCQKDLAGKILKSTGNITMVLDNLEKRGLVERRRSTEDRRYIRVQLTPDGQLLIARIFPSHADRIRRRMAALDPEELILLETYLRKLGRSSSPADVEKETCTGNGPRQGRSDRGRDPVRIT